jgi:methionyl-tRNA synthetase
VEKYGAEALRYYLMSDIATGKDADFSEERLIERFNAELANSFGNLLNRTLNMANRYRSGVLRKRDEKVRYRASEGDEKPFADLVSFHVERYPFQMEGRDDVSLAIYETLGISALCNGLAEAAAPWKIAKDEDPDKAKRLDAVLYVLVESLRIIAILISPVLPKAAHGIFDQLNWKIELSGKEERFSLKDAEWGGLPDGHVVGKPVPLFPRIEL